MAVRGLSGRQANGSVAIARSPDAPVSEGFPFYRSSARSTARTDGFSQCSPSVVGVEGASVRSRMT